MSSEISVFSKRNIAKISLILLLFIAIYFSAILRLLHTWYSNSEYSHGFFILPISLFLVWKKRRQLLSIPLLPARGGIPILVGGLFIYLLGTLGQIATFVYLSFLITILGILLALIGRQVVKELSFPLIYLFFMFPVPSTLYARLTSSLQLLASKITISLIQFLGIPGSREGNLIFLPNFSLEVATACSGLRSLISLLALSAIFAYLTQKSNAQRVILFLSAVPIAFCANIFRILTAGVFSYLYGSEVTKGFLHQFSGVVVFLFSIVSLFLVREIIKWMWPKGTTVS